MKLRDYIIVQELMDDYRNGGIAAEVV